MFKRTPTGSIYSSPYTFDFPVEDAAACARQRTRRGGALATLFSALGQVEFQFQFTRLKIHPSNQAAMHTNPSKKSPMFALSGQD